MVILPWKMTK